MKPWIKIALIVTATWSLQGCTSAVMAGSTVVSTSISSSNLSLKTQVDDATINAQAMNIINRTPNIEYRSNIEVVVFNRQVLLLGQVPNEAVKNTLAEKISKIEGVTVVFNHLKVAASNGIKRYSEDSWITAKIKANFIGKVNPFHFKVVTEDGVVYLLGITTTTEGQQAAEIASRTSGVKKVVKDFTYIKLETKKTKADKTETHNVPQENEDATYNRQDLTHVRNNG